MRVGQITRRLVSEPWLFSRAFFQIVELGVFLQFRLLFGPTGWSGNFKNVEPVLCDCGVLQILPAQAARYLRDS